MGWHLYLRENMAFKRNKDGRWGWIRTPQMKPELESLGINIKGDGTCDDDGIAEFARRYPIKGRRCGGKLRGCIEVDISKNGEIKMANEDKPR